MDYKGTMAIRFWLGVASAEYAAWAVASGVHQVSAQLRAEYARIGRADGLVLYSPRRRAGEEQPLRDFTALGRVADSGIVRVDGETVPGEHWRPFRRRVEWFPEASPVPLRLMAPVLDFAQTGPDWAAPLRRGLVEISARDFQALRLAMRPVPPE